MEEIRKTGFTTIKQIKMAEFHDEYKRLCKILLRLEPRFDFSIYDGRILNSIVSWVWVYDDKNDLKWDFNKGLFLSGAIGRGKTLTLRLLYEYIADVVNRVPELYDEHRNRLGRMWQSASMIANSYAAEGLPGLEGLIKPRQCLFIDEMGREPNPVSNYGTKMNVIQFLLQIRYDNRHRSVTHVTTNMTLDDVAEEYGLYIADRCLEMFNFIEFNGESLRK